MTEDLREWRIKHAAGQYSGPFFEFPYIRRKDTPVLDEIERRIKREAFQLLVWLLESQIKEAA